MIEPKYVAKAIVALCASAAGSVATAAAEGGVTGIESVLIILTAIGSAAAVFVTKNAARPSESEGRVG